MNGLAANLRKYGLTKLYHLAAQENVPSILVRGIYCRERAREKNVILRDISDQRVQHRRRFVPGSKKKIHEFVPLFIATGTPMQWTLTHYSRRHPRREPLSNEELVVLELDALRVFRSKGIYFTEGNAASSATKFFTSPTDLARLDWVIIRTPNCYSAEYKRKKSAEVLVPNEVSADYIVGIVVFNDKAKRRLRDICRRAFNKLIGTGVRQRLRDMNALIRVDRELFFGEADLSELSF